MDGGGGGEDGRRRALRWETVTAGTIAMGDQRWRQRRNERRDGGMITMCSIEIAVDGGGGDGRQWHNGRQDGRAASAGQGDGVRPSFQF